MRRRLGGQQFTDVQEQKLRTLAVQIFTAAVRKGGSGPLRKRKRLERLRAQDAFRANDVLRAYAIHRLVVADYNDVPNELQVCVPVDLKQRLRERHDDAQASGDWFGYFRVCLTNAMAKDWLNGRLMEYAQQ